MSARNPIVVVGTAVSSLLLALASPAAAQEPARGETVTERARPDWDPVGIRAGAFVILPQLTLSEVYDDNVFAAERGEKDDFITLAEPRIKIDSDWSNHALGIEAGAAIARFATNGKEDYEDFDIAVGGRVDITRDSSIGLRLAYRARHEDRASPDDVLGLAPTEYNVVSAKATATRKFNRYAVSVTATYDGTDYDDAPTSTTIVNNDDRDRDVYNAILQISYEIVPAYEAFVRLGANAREYRDAVDDGGLNRDSDGFSAVVGTVIDFSGVTFGEVFIGYRRQRYDAATLPKITGPAVGAEIVWNVSGLTTLKGEITRTIEETTQADASGFFSTRLGASVDHELRRNLLLNANVAVTDSDYKGITRTDTFLKAGFGARYLIDRTFFVAADFTHEERDSDIAGSDFAGNTLMLSLGIQR